MEGYFLNLKMGIDETLTPNYIGILSFWVREEDKISPITSIQRRAVSPHHSNSQEHKIKANQARKEEVKLSVFADENLVYKKIPRNTLKND